MLGKSIQEGRDTTRPPKFHISLGTIKRNIFLDEMNGPSQIQSLIDNSIMIQVPNIGVKVRKSVLEIHEQGPKGNDKKERPKG